MEIKVGKNDVAKRLDKFLIQRLDNFNNSLIYKLIRKKDIKVNGKRAVFNQILALDDVVFIYGNFKLKEKVINLSHQPLDIEYQNDDFMILWKDQGILSHGDGDSLQNRVINYLIQKKEYSLKDDGLFKPSLVNRLDRNTSGFVIVAKNYSSLKKLNSLMEQRLFKKYYLARCSGKLKEHDHLVDYHQSLSDNLVKIVSKAQNGFKKIELKYQKITDNLIEIELLTGKKHQIRAQLAHHGIYLDGEKKYTYNQKAKYQSLVAYKLIFEYKFKKYIFERRVEFGK